MASKGFAHCPCLTLPFLPCLLFFLQLSTHATLVHRYAFEGFATEVADSIGDQHGTFEGGASLKGNGAITLDGANDYVSLPGGLVSRLENATLETWVTWAGPPDKDWPRIFEIGRDSSHYLYLSPRTGSSPRHARFGIAGGGPERKVNADDQLPGDGQTRNHLVVTFTADTRKVIFYLDGVEQGSTISTVPLKGFPDENTWLGRSHFSWVPTFAGSIHEFRIYDHVLTPGQVQKNFSAGPDLLPGPVIELFSSDRSKVHSGSRVNLVWQVSEGATGTIDPGGILVAAPTGSTEVQILADTTFILTVADSEGVRSSSIDLKVDDRPEIQSFTASREKVAPGDEITLSWEVAYADRILIDNVPVTGSTHTVTVSGPHTFKLEAENRHGSRKSETMVTVEEGGVVLISEYLAVNDDNLPDEYGDSSDWIEVENPGVSDINLGDWFTQNTYAVLEKGILQLEKYNK